MLASSTKEVALICAENLRLYQQYRQASSGAGHSHATTGKRQLRRSSSDESEGSTRGTTSALDSISETSEEGVEVSAKNLLEVQFVKHDFRAKDATFKLPFI